jgi:DNA-binding NarL/FixJ family response regulator
MPPDFTPPAAGDPDTAGLDNAVDRLTELTPQQLKILSLVCEGKLNKQIAFDLSIAETTVKAHITAILRKLGVSSRTQAVLIAQKASYAGILKA